ncbi:MAG: dihydrofolate reductase family protein [Pseudomonadota bacterium]
MSKEVIRLFPGAGESEPLKGLYLRRPILAEGNPTRPIVYANFLSSLDGRIALFDAQNNQYVLPSQLKCDEDFQLFLELYAQADCIITHGGYMRSLAAGRLGNVLQLPKHKSVNYLHQWRKQHELATSPDVVILSGSLDFPWDDSLNSSGQNVHLVTGGNTEGSQIQNWQRAGHKIHQFGNKDFVDVELLMEFLHGQGYKSVYLVAGPHLLQDLMMRGWVDHFFLTISQQFLGGESFKTLFSGPVLEHHGRLQLERLYMDLESSNGVGQLYSEYVLKD